MKKKLRFLVFATFLISMLNYGQVCNTVQTFDGPLTFADSQYSYLNCFQYVRHALLNNGVDMSNGKFLTAPSSYLPNGNIADDDKFVKVCNKDYAEAISLTTSSHAAVVLNGGIFTGGSGDFACTPGSGSYVYRHGIAGAVAGGPGIKYFNYYAVLPEIEGSSSLNLDNSDVYEISENKGYIHSINWSVSGNSLSIIGTTTGPSIMVKATCNSGSGMYYVQAAITIKDANNNPGETVFVKKYINVNCNSTPTCFNNTIDNNTLNTFNYVAPNINHKVLMSLSRTWNKSWGTTTYWYTSNAGKEMNFMIPSGCATFTAYNSTCGTQTFTFCASSSSYLKTATTTEDKTPFKVYDIRTGKMVRSGLLKDYEGESPIQGLPDGFYVLHMNGTKRKVVVKNN